MANQQEDIIVAKYVLDANQFKSQLDATNKKLGESGAVIDQNGKKITALSNNFQKSGQVIGESMMKGSTGMKALAAQTDKVEQEIKSLATATTDVTAKTETLRARYKKAMLDVQDGIEGAAERAGELKDQMDDAAESVRNLASGSKLEQFSSQLGTVGSKIAALDFGGAADAAKQLQSITSKLSIKETLGDVKNLGSTLLSTATSLINPFTLVVASIAAIAYGIYSVITAEDAEITKLKELQAVQQTRFELEANGIDNEIKDLKALGKSTKELEDKKLELAIKNQQVKVKLAKAQYAIEREAAVNALALLFDREEAEKRIAAKEEEGANDKFKALRQAELDLANFQGDLSSSRLARTKEFSDILVAGFKNEADQINEQQKEAADKSRDIQKKLHDDRLAKEKLFAQAELEEQTAPIIKTTQALEMNIEQRREIISGFFEQSAMAAFEDYELNLKLLEDSEVFEEAAYEKKLQMLNDYLLAGKISKEQFDAEAEAIEQEKFAKDIERLQQRFDIAQGYLNAGMAINDAVSQIQKNKLKEGERLSISQQQAAFNREKALNIAQAGINGAQAILKTFATLGFPAGIPFAAIMAIQTGLQIAAIQGKNFVPQGFAEGTPLVKGGVKGKDSVPAMLMPNERVVTEADNMKHWDDLEAIRKGNYESHLRMKYIVPALRNHQNELRGMENESFANNIANSLMMNSTWKGGNIVRALSELDSNENKRTAKLVNALKGESRKARVNR